MTAPVRRTRNPFIDLQRDHSSLLQHAVRLQRGSSAGGALAHQAARDYLMYWDRAVVLHLIEEERCVLPAAIDQSLAGNIRVGNDKLRHQSDWLRVAVIEPSLLRDALGDVAGVIRHHVRMMEFEFFDNIREAMGRKRAEWIAGKCLEYRRSKRPDAIGRERKEETFLGP